MISKDPNCPSCRGRSSSLDKCQLCECPDARFVRYYRDDHPGAYVRWILNTDKFRYNAIMEIL